MSAPTIPPRPQRAQAGPTAVNPTAAPHIPPRPARKNDRSPSRDAMTRSPLNLPPTSMTNGKSYNQNGGLSAPPSGLGPRRPSVNNMPSVGQEGMEYDSFDQLPQEAHGVKVNNNNNNTSNEPDPATVQQTRHADVPMHAPKASVPQSTATSRISTVTRTDSSQAAAAGIGQPRPEDDVHKLPAEAIGSLTRVTSREPANSLRAKASFNRSSSNLHSGTSRPGSVHGESEYEHGIPAIGQQIPLFKNAGDVQAPSPAQAQAQFPSGIGFFNDGTSRNHHRKRSSRQEFGPPGSYGLHGHPGQGPSDQFERDWLLKHPDIAAKEGYNVYGGLTPRPETALSSEQLNKLVQAKNDVGFGTSPHVISTPDQDIGYRASEEYTSRMNSPKPSPAPLTELKKRPSSTGLQPPSESPLRKTSFPFNDRDQAVDEDDNIIHVDEPKRRMNKVTGGGDADNALDLGPDGEEGGIIDEHARGTPILASDEMIKRPESAWMQPAVSPEAERTEFDHGPSRRSSMQPSSRPSSRPNSMHGGFHGNSLHRFISHEDHQGSGVGTPLEEIEEYEPLFPEGEEGKKTIANKLKSRPGLAQHHFPSQDIWEDTPQSLQFTTSVETPEPEREPKSAGAEVPASAVFETPEQEQRRRTQNPEDMTSDSKTFAKPHFKAGVRDEQHHGRPGQRRFPSQDIWEDTPDSMRLETTVSGPQMEEVKSPEDEQPNASSLASEALRPQIPTRPQKSSKLAQDITEDIAPEATQEDPREREVPDLGAPKETSPTKTKAPAIPDRPKPSVPARPARTSRSDQAEGAGAPLSKSTSATSAGSEEAVTSPPLPKAKPAVPGKPAGNKFANIKASFMNDLNSRLQFGPQGPPPKAQEPEPEMAAEEEKAPLVDARKSRARGPARRKAPSGAAEPSASSPFSFSMTTMTLWHIDEADELKIADTNPESATEPSASEAEKVLTSNVASDAFDAQDSPATNPSSNVSVVGPATPLEKDNPLGTPQTKAAAGPQTSQLEAQIGAHGDMPTPSISPAVIDETEAVRPELEQALKQAEPAPENAEETEAKLESIRAKEPNMMPNAAVGGVANGEEAVRQTEGVEDV